MGDRAIEGMLGESHRLFLQGDDDAAIRACENTVSEFGSNEYAVDSILSQLMDFGHDEVARGLIAKYSLAEDRIAPELVERLGQIREARESRGDRTRTWTRLGLRKRGDLPRVLWPDRSFARSITVGDQGVEIKRAFSTQRFSWGQVSEVVLEPREATAAFGYSTFTYRREILTFHGDVGARTIDVSTFRPEFVDPADIVDQVRRFVLVREAPLVSRSGRGRMKRLIGNATFLLTLVVAAWYFNR